MQQYHPIEWLQRCRDIAEQLSSIDTHEWAMDSLRGNVRLTTETGLELLLRNGKRITVMGLYGAMEACAPSKRLAGNPFGTTERCTITEDARKDAATIAKAIVRRCLPRYRVFFAETAARYAVEQQRQNWEQETLTALYGASAGNDRTDHSEVVYLRSGSVVGKATTSAIYGVHLDLNYLSQAQALAILTYLEASRDLRHRDPAS